MRAAPRENWRVFRSEISEPFSYYIFKPFSLDLRYVFRSLKLDRNSYWVPYDLRSSRCKWCKHCIKYSRLRTPRNNNNAGTLYVSRRWKWACTYQFGTTIKTKKVLILPSEKRNILIQNTVVTTYDFGSSCSERKRYCDFERKTCQFSLRVYIGNELKVMFV